jgi:hypothetical protein
VGGDLSKLKELLVTETETTEAETNDVVGIFQKLVESSIDEEGVFPHQMIFEDCNGKLNMVAIALYDSIQCMMLLKKTFDKGAKKIIFGLDRLCKEGQGTTLGDCVAGHYWNGEIWQPFVLEYQNEPRIVKPIDFENNFWNQQLKRELRSVGIE